MEKYNSSGCLKHDFPIIHKKISPQRGLIFLFGYQNVLFQVFIQPMVESSLPEDTVLWLQHPVVFIREIKEFGIDATKHGSIVSLHALREANAVVQTAVDDKDWSRPFVDKEVGRLCV